MKLTEEEVVKFTACLKDGLTFKEGIWVMEFYNNGVKYQSQEIQNTEIRIFKDLTRVQDKPIKDKSKLKENLEVECFDRDGFLKFAEKDGKDVPITRKDITVNEWTKIKNNTIKQKNNSHNL